MSLPIILSINFGTYLHNIIMLFSQSSKLAKFKSRLLFWSSPNNFNQFSLLNKDVPKGKTYLLELPRRPFFWREIVLFTWYYLHHQLTFRQTPSFYLRPTITIQSILVSFCTQRVKWTLLGTKTPLSIRLSVCHPTVSLEPWYLDLNFTQKKYFCFRKSECE